MTPQAFHDGPNLQLAAVRSAPGDGGVAWVEPTVPQRAAVHAAHAASEDVRRRYANVDEISFALGVSPLDLAQEAREQAHPLAGPVVRRDA